MNNPRYSLINKAVAAQGDRKKAVVICGAHQYMVTHVAFDAVQTDGLVHGLLPDGSPIWLMPEAIDGIIVRDDA